MKDSVVAGPALKRSMLFVMAAIIGALDKNWVATRFMAAFAIVVFCSLIVTSLETRRRKAVAVVVGVSVSLAMLLLEATQQQYLWTMVWALIAASSIWHFSKQRLR